MTLTAILAVAACLVGANAQCTGSLPQTILQQTAVPVSVVDNVIAQSLIDTIQLMVVSNLLEEKVQPIGYDVVETISPCRNNIAASSYISPINSCGQNLKILPPQSDQIIILPPPCNPCCNPCNCNQTSCSCNNCKCNPCCCSFVVPSRCNYCAAPCSPCASPCNPCGSPCNQCNMPCNTCSFCCPCNSCSCDGNCNQNSCNCNSCSGNPCSCNQCYNLVLPPMAPQLPCGVGFRPAAAPVVAASYSGCCSSCGNNFKAPCGCVPVVSPCCGATIAAPVCPDISCLVRPLCG